MTINLTFDGTTQCRGGNRLFSLRTAVLTHGTEPYTHVNVELYARTPAAVPTIALYVSNPEELRTLICGLAKALAQMTTITEKEDV